MKSGDGREGKKYFCKIDLYYVLKVLVFDSWQSFHWSRKLHTLTVTIIFISRKVMQPYPAEQDLLNPQKLNHTNPTTVNCLLDSIFDILDSLHSLNHFGHNTLDFFLITLYPCLVSSSVPLFFLFHTLNEIIPKICFYSSSLSSSHPSVSSSRLPLLSNLIHSHGFNSHSYAYNFQLCIFTPFFLKPDSCAHRQPKGSPWLLHRYLTLQI